jgi:hypothetical protein
VEGNRSSVRFDPMGGRWLSGAPPRLRSAGVELLFDMWVATSCSSKFPWSDGAPGRASSILVMASRGAFVELIRS